MPFAFRYLWRSASFWAVIVLFAVGNLASFFEWSSDAAAERTYGFPFPAYIADLASDGPRLYVTGLLLDIALPCTVGLLVVWIVRLLRREEPLG